ncbi:nucleotide sugar dehydrogenase [Amylibacter sp.]|nr:nucleotide sugar dehydrogenase [Amylibacter sp.]
MKNEIAIIGLGYVGLPLAVEFAKHYPVVGFDINEARILELKKGHDATKEVSDGAMKVAIDGDLTVTSDESILAVPNIYIITVPTPVDRNNNPDFRPLLIASDLVGRHIKKGDYIIYESTVYPGATEEVCVPVVEASSGMIFNIDFYVGFSPERINPGDKVNTLTTIKKVTSGSTEAAAKFIDGIYQSITTAGTHMAESIRVAEASKVIENTQRDVNIAFANEIAKIFDLLGINTQQVFAAAGTKWNFLKFSPGLVGGHCIGVDPYYLVHKAQEHGYSPNVLLQSRLINESMGEFIADKVIKLMCKNHVEVVGSKVLIMGFSFKENCPDLRNTKVIDVVNGLKNYQCQVDIVDPWVDVEEAYKEYDLKIDKKITGMGYSAIIIAVGHNEFKELDTAKLRKHMKNHGIIFDVKGSYNCNEVEGQL